MLHAADGARGPTLLVGDACCGRPFWLGSTLNGHLADLAYLVGSTSCWDCWDWASEGAAPFKPFLDRMRATRKCGLYPPPQGAGCRVQAEAQAQAQAAAAAAATATPSSSKPSPAAQPRLLEQVRERVHAQTQAQAQEQVVPGTGYRTQHAQVQVVQVAPLVARTPKLAPTRHLTPTGGLERVCSTPLLPKL